jgi:hypothetical protein
MTIVFMLPHITYLDGDIWVCWACHRMGTTDESRWAHEEAHEGQEVELPFEDPRVEGYLDWIASIEDSEIEAAREIDCGQPRDSHHERGSRR